jgi:hypothetical protein
MSRQAKVLIGSGVLAVISEAMLWTVNESYGKLIDNTNLLGIVAFLFHLPGEWISGSLGLTPPGDHGMTQILVASGGLQFLLIYWGSITVLLRFAPRHSAEPGASPNGGPAHQLVSSSVSGGPPSVS